MFSHFPIILSHSIQDIFKNAPGGERLLYQPEKRITEFNHQLAAAKNINAVQAVLTAIGSEGIFPTATLFYNILNTLGEFQEWMAAKKLYNLMCQSSLTNNTTHSSMFTIASNLSQYNFAVELYEKAVIHNFVNTRMHNKMIILAEKIQRMDLARKVYQNAVSTNTADEITHKNMIDVLVLRNYLSEAITIYNKNKFPGFTAKNSAGTTEIDLHGQSYGTAYIGLTNLLFNTKEPTTFIIITGKGIHSKKPKPLPAMQQVIIDIVSEADPRRFYLEVNINNLGRYILNYSPHKLRASAKPFYPAFEVEKPFFSQSKSKKNVVANNTQNKSRRKSRF